MLLLLEFFTEHALLKGAFFAMLGINEGDWQAKPVGHPKGHPLALVVCGLLGATFKLLNCIELLNSV